MKQHHESEEKRLDPSLHFDRYRNIGSYHFSCYGTVRLRPSCVWNRLCFNSGSDSRYLSRLQGSERQRTEKDEHLLA